ncbi:MAG: hypothetical protein SGPRY_006342, partial [Prymnesium sp.]
RELESRPRRVIVKPDAGSQGDGIFIADSWADIRLRTTCSNRPHIAQQYISSPLTLHGLKFDIRVYVLISSLHPLKVHICREGLIDVCELPTFEFVPPAGGKRATPSSKSPAYCKPCNCMEMGGIHFHRRCLVDEMAKRTAVGGALDILLGRHHSKEIAHAETLLGAVDRARRIFEACMDRKGCLSSTRARKLLLVGAGLSSAEADIAFMRAKQAIGTGEMRFDAFVDMLLDQCTRKAHTVADINDQFCLMLDSMESLLSENSALRVVDDSFISIFVYR